MKRLGLSMFCFFLTILVHPETIAATGDWPQLQGPNRDCHVPAGTPAPSKLPTQLEPVWKVAVGSGHSAPVVAGGKIVFLDEQDGQETAHLLEGSSGKEVWRTPIDAVYGDEWGSGPRSTPMIDGDRVYVQSCRGEFRCLGLADGETIWRINFEKDYRVQFLGSKASSGTAARRGNNGCGVVDEERVYVPVGSTAGAGIVCFDKVTGKELWKSLDDEAAYSSFVVRELAGVKQLVAFTAEALVGLDPSSGHLLWRVPFKTAAKRHVATPVKVGDLILVNSHTFGLAATKIDNSGDKWATTPAWLNKDLRINLATPVLVGRYLYSQGSKKDYVCVDSVSGEVKWSQPGFGRGGKDYSSTLVMGEKLLVLTEDGTLILLAVNPEEYTELGRLQVCGNTWCFPAYSNGRLFVRDGRSLTCLDLLGGNQ